MGAACDGCTGSCISGTYTRSATISIRIRFHKQGLGNSKKKQIRGVTRTFRNSGREDI